MMDINFIASYSASEDGIICSMAGYCWLLNPCPCDIVHVLLILRLIIFRPNRFHFHLTGSAASSEVEVC